MTLISDTSISEARVPFEEESLGNFEKGKLKIAKKVCKLLADANLIEHKFFRFQQNITLLSSHPHQLCEFLESISKKQNLSSVLDYKLTIPSTSLRMSIRNHLKTFFLGALKQEDGADNALAHAISGIFLKESNTTSELAFKIHALVENSSFILRPQCISDEDLKINLINNAHFLTVQSEIPLKDFINPLIPSSSKPMLASLIENNGIPPVLCLMRYKKFFSEARLPMAFPDDENPELRRAN